MHDVESVTVEPLPIYTENDIPQAPFDVLLTRIAASSGDPEDRVILDSFVESQRPPAYDRPKKTEPPKPVDRFPDVPRYQADPLTRVKQHIVSHLFYAIKRGDNEAIDLLIKNNLVTANTTSEFGQTPLLEAIGVKNVPLVKELLDYGADVNAFGVIPFGVQTKAKTNTRAVRTPLMLAATLGSLPLVRLLLETHQADDAIIAPDGQLALRLAVENGHREVVDYLPSRRGGGFRRWQTAHAKAIERIRYALRKIGIFVKFFVWHVPRFFLWSVPKHLVVKPVMEGCKWCWKHRKGFGRWCKHQITETPGRVERAAKWVWKGVKKVPTVLKDAGKGAWKFATETLPRWLKKAVLWVWSLLTEKIPKAIVAVVKWICAGISSIAKAIWNVVLKTVSLLHTVVEAVITFLRNLTLVDIWNGFCALLRAIFITFPKTLWSWISNFGDVSLKVMTTVFGFLGEVIWMIIAGLGYVALYVPKKIWVILQSIGSSFGKAWYEVVVWFSPKA